MKVLSHYRKKIRALEWIRGKRKIELKIFEGEIVRQSRLLSELEATMEDVQDEIRRLKENLEISTRPGRSVDPQIIFGSLNYIKLKEDQLTRKRVAFDREKNKLVIKKAQWSRLKRQMEKISEKLEAQHRLNKHEFAQLMSREIEDLMIMGGGKKNVN